MGTALTIVFAIGALAAAVAMVIARHPMRVALALVVAMLCLAGVYAALGVHVIAVFQVLIYVGAVMVFMVYVIMLLDVRDSSYARRFSPLLVPGIVAAVALVAALLVVVVEGPPRQSAAPATTIFGVQAFSQAFLNDYWLHFELVSVLLVAAVVAAIAVVKAGSRRHG
jgi:NADH-quinone oxidoreductase subunit J